MSQDIFQEIVFTYVVKNLIPTKPQSQNLRKPIVDDSREIENTKIELNTFLFEKNRRTVLCSDLIGWEPPLCSKNYVSF